MDERPRGQTPGLHILPVSKRLWRLCVSSSPDAAFPVKCTDLGPLPPLPACRLVYHPLKIVTRKLSYFTVMLWEPAVLQHTPREHQLINNNGGFYSQRGCLLQ